MKIRNNIKNYLYVIFSRLVRRYYGKYCIYLLYFLQLKVAGDSLSALQDLYFDGSILQH